MKHSELKLRQWKLCSLVAALLVGFATIRPMQSVAQQVGPAPASIHGHVQNAAGLPLNKGEVRLTLDKSADMKGKKFPYIFPLDNTGNYTGTGIAPGDYAVIVFQGDTSIDFITSLKLVAGDNKVVDFDMTRKEYIDKMSSEERKALEDYKKQAGEAIAANAKIQNLNTMLVSARADNKAGNYASAITTMQTATAAKPDEPILWVTLGDAQLGAADAAAKEAKAAGKPSSDPDVAQKYTDATVSYKKAIDLNAAAKKPNPEAAASAYNQMGTSYAKMGDAKESSDAFENAAKTLPAQAGMYYFNESATLYNAGKMDDAVAAADKAIAADPKRADAYYIKGQALITKATVDPKTQKIVAPPGCVDAYQTYLELAPDGSHAADVKGVLAGIGEQVKSTYKAAPAAKKK